jgi:methyltransferase (TIGR00027 family)
MSDASHSAPSLPRIEHVSDTALWVANYRALETERKDALFRDPLAARLVGERGQKLARSMPQGKMMAWVMALRTVAIDRLILQALALGCDTVLNLGAGLDTRPYRLSLPASLRWIEVDFPQMVTFKDEALSSEAPVCRLERVPLDLSDREARRALLERVAGEGARVAVITEGLLLYLSNDDAASLADDLYAAPGVAYWIHDYHQGELVEQIRKSWRNRLEAAPIRLRVPDWFAFAKAHGWEQDETVYLVDEARRHRRLPPFIFPWSLIGPLLPPHLKERMRKGSGYVRLKKGPRAG